MTKGSGRSGSAGCSVCRFFAILCNLLAGFLTGLIAPVAAIAAIVAGVRLITGRVPFLGRVAQDEEGQRLLSLQLVPPEQVNDMLAEHKRTFGDELGKLQAEFRGMAQRAKAQDD